VISAFRSFDTGHPALGHRGRASRSGLVGRPGIFGLEREMDRRDRVAALHLFQRHLGRLSMCRRPGWTGGGSARSHGKATGMPRADEFLPDCPLPRSDSRIHTDRLQRAALRREFEPLHILVLPLPGGLTRSLIFIAFSSKVDCSNAVRRIADTSEIFDIPTATTHRHSLMTVRTAATRAPATWRRKTLRTNVPRPAPNRAASRVARAQPMFLLSGLACTTR